MADYPRAITTPDTLVAGVTQIQAAWHNAHKAETIAIETELGINLKGSAVDLKTRLARSLDAVGNLDFATSTELTIASDSITPTQNWHNVDTQADAASDDLSTVVATSLSDGFVLFIRPNNDGRTVIVKHNVGNILCASGADITLDDQRDVCFLIYDATLTKWIAAAFGVSGMLDFATSTELTIATGSITPTQNWHTVDTQSDAASDDLDTIVATAFTDGFVLFIRPNNDARTVVVKHNTGNILCGSGSDYTLDNQRNLCILIYDATLTKWIASYSSGASGAFVQRVESQTGAVATGTTTIPIDDTIPQNTEGTEFLSLAITPTDSANYLDITVLLNVAASAANRIISALFQDATANALCAGLHNNSTAGIVIQIMMKHRMLAGTTSSTTFKVRAGASSAATVTINGESGASVLGGVLISSITIDEVRP